MFISKGHLMVSACGCCSLRLWFYKQGDYRLQKAHLVHYLFARYQTTPNKQGDYRLQKAHLVHYLFAPYQTTPNKQGDYRLQKAHWYTTYSHGTRLPPTNKVITGYRRIGIRLSCHNRTPIIAKLYNMPFIALETGFLMICKILFYRQSDAFV